MSQAHSALLPLVGPLGLVLVTLVARGGPRTRVVREALALASSVGLLAALASIVHLVSVGPSHSALLGMAGVGASIRLDGLSVAIFTMIALLVTVIGRFSSTYLEGDRRHGLFLGRLALTAASVEVLVLANNLLLFWLAWVATSVSLHGLLVFYRDRPRAIIAARKKLVAARLGDLTLGFAFLLLALRSGTGEMTMLTTTLPEADATTAGAGLLLAATALLKSAQFPMHGWLVEVMETPTPVSALLHAGILNAGPFLILRFAAVIDRAPAAMWLLIIVGGLTALFASAVLRTQPSIKVALGYSSSAHMGFMLFVCGLGVYPAAALHLVAHSFYKAHAFLSAGSTVELARASGVVVPPRTRHGLRVLVGFVAACSTYAGVAWLLGFTPWHHPALLLVGAVVVLGLTQLLGKGFDTKAPARVVVATVAVGGAVATAFFGLEELSRIALSDSLPELSAKPSSTLALAGLIFSLWAAAVALQLFGFGGRTRLGRRLRIHLRHGLYANAVFDRLVGAMKLPSKVQGTPSR